MTLVVALKWLMADNSEAVLVTSDSRATGPFGLVHEERKIYPIFYRDIPLGLAGGSGASYLVKYGFRTAEQVLWEVYENKQTEEPLTFEEFEVAIKYIERALVTKLRELRDEDIEFSFSMILAGVDPRGIASMYLFNQYGLAEPVHITPGFALIGSGYITGGYLLLNLLGYTPQALDLGLLSAFIIDAVSEVDSRVGSFVGESWLMRVEKGKVTLGQLTEQALFEFKERIQKRKQLIQLLWQKCSEVGENKVRNTLINLKR